MAIPPRFRPDGCLDEGIHEADWAEFSARFGTNDVRAKLLTPLLEFCHLLHVARCAELYVDGSFVTDKEQPGDVDVCFDALSVDDAFVLWTWAAQKKRFPLLDIKADFAGAYLNLFQLMRESDAKKGIICLQLNTLPASQQA